MLGIAVDFGKPSWIVRECWLRVLPFLDASMERRPSRRRTRPAAVDCCSPQTRTTDRSRRDCHQAAGKPTEIPHQPKITNNTFLVVAGSVSIGLSTKISKFNISGRNGQLTLHGLTLFWVEAQVKLLCNLKYLPRWEFCREFWQSLLRTTSTWTLFKTPL